MMDPATMASAMGGAGGLPAAKPSGANVGACFQLALLAAGQGNDQEAGNYLRQIIASMKTMVPMGEPGAGAGQGS